ncbi:LptF/LptG family permease [Campylobacter sp.]|uniref:LptF/LptG family permease n=1 Tax=Campylobacter sp. TaxID=205 RepID=UPI0025DDDF6C|nr:LptF/LptG family permease [Campylobacter sp.]
MKLYVKYAALSYLKYFFILLIALECFYVGIDVLTNLKDFPSSANTALLYIALTAAVALSYTLPLSLIFALILMGFNMIRSNELVSFYALGVSKNALIIPPFLIALAITVGFIALNSTPFAYALKFQKNLTDLSPTGGDMFLKFEGKYIYIKALNGKNANDITIFDMGDNSVVSRSHASSGEYAGKIWHLRDVNTTTLPAQLKLGGSGLRSEFSAQSEALKGFDPSSIASVYDTSNVYSIRDALRSIRTFSHQGVNISTIKASLYNMIFFPLFAPLAVLVLYYYLPVTGRFFNLALLSFGFFIATLCAWGVLFVLIRFSLNGVIIPELGIIVPVTALLGFAAFLVFKHR